MKYFDQIRSLKKDDKYYLWINSWDKIKNQIQQDQHFIQLIL